MSCEAGHIATPVHFREHSLGGLLLVWTFGARRKASAAHVDTLVRLRAIKRFPLVFLIESKMSATSLHLQLLGLLGLLGVYIEVFPKSLAVALIFFGVHHAHIRR